MIKLNEYLPYIVDICFALTFVIITMDTKRPTRRVVLFGIFWATIFASLFYALYCILDWKLFLFYFPITSLMAGMFYSVYVSAFDGSKAIFPFLVAVYFITVSNSILETIEKRSDISTEILQIVQVIIFIIVLTAIWFFVRSFFMTVLRYTSSGWFIMDLSLLIYALMIYMMDVIFDSYNMTPVQVGLEILMLVIFIAILLIITRTLGEKEEDFAQRMLEEQKKAISEQAINFRENEKKISILRHDMRHDIAIVTQLIEEGRIEEALQTLKATDDALERSKTVKYCENVYINATFVLLQRKARKEGFDIIYKTDIREGESLDTHQLAIVLSNLIENAINACAKLEDISERYIEVSARDTGFSLILRITNSFDGNITFDNNGYPVAGKEGHGIGTKSVTEFIRANDGMIDYSADGNKFTVKVLVNYG